MIFPRPWCRLDFGGRGANRSPGGGHDDTSKDSGARSGCACRAWRNRAGAGQAQGRGRPARRLREFGFRTRPGQGLLQEARPRPRRPLHAGLGRDPAGGDLRLGRYRHRRRHAFRHGRLLQGRPHPRHRLDNHRCLRILVRARGFTHQDVQGRRRQDGRLFHQWLLDHDDGRRHAKAVRHQGEADRHGQPDGDFHAGDERPD